MTRGPRAIAAFVPTFRRSQLLRETLARLLAQSRPPDLVLVVDNASDEATEEVVREVGADGLEYHPMPENVGPAGAAAFAVETLRSRGFEWILWGDDDDPPRTPDALQRLDALIDRERADELAGVAAVGARWDWTRGEARRLRDGELAGTLDVDVVGGGQGLLLRTAALDASGPPDRRLFFGLEEIELCLRLRRAGLRLLVDGDLMRRYREDAGRLDLTVRRSPWRFWPVHTLWRRYYTVRNYIFLMRNTFGRPDLARREIGKAAARCLAGWVRGPRYGLALASYQILGVRDGLAGRLGRTIAPSPSTREKRTSA